jgi:hypothetical protein
MSNGGGAGGGSSFGGVQSAADAPDPNDVIAKLKAAPTQAAATLLKVMTLPLQPLLPDPPARSGAQTRKVLFPRGMRRAKPQQSWTPTTSVLDRRNRPRLRYSLSQVLCQLRNHAEDCDKAATLIELSKHFHAVNAG